jgi:hypothetical protein
MERPVSRRAWFAALASGVGAFATACQSSPGVTELTSPEGKILQWEGDNLLVIVSGIQPRYRVGEVIRVNLLVNNQATATAQVHLRTKLLGRGDQAVVQAEVAILTVRPEDAANVDRELPLGRGFVPGEYSLSVEVPPWSLEGRETGRGATLRTRIQIDPAG